MPERQDEVLACMLEETNIMEEHYAQELIDMATFKEEACRVKWKHMLNLRLTC